MTGMNGAGGDCFEIKNIGADTANFTNVRIANGSDLNRIRVVCGLRDYTVSTVNWCKYWGIGGAISQTLSSKR